MLAIGPSSLAHLFVPRSTQLYPTTHYLALGYRSVVLVTSLEGRMRRRFMKVDHLCIIYEKGYLKAKLLPSLI